MTMSTHFVILTIFSVKDPRRVREGGALADFFEELSQRELLQPTTRLIASRP